MGRAVIDRSALEKLSEELGQTPTGVMTKITEPVYEAVERMTEPVREVFVGVPELKTFIVGYAFGAGTIALALLILAIVIRING
jgi:hypothetical protein